MIWIDLPAPPSVNRTRRIDWRNFKDYAAWRQGAGNCILAARRRPEDPILGRRVAGEFEIDLIVGNQVRADPDNLIKAVLDLLLGADLVDGDSPRFCRRIVVSYGDAPMGLRATLRPFGKERGKKPRARDNGMVSR